MTTKVRSGKAMVRTGRATTHAQTREQHGRTSQVPRSAWNSTLESELRAQLEAKPLDLQPGPCIAVVVPVLARPARVRPLVESFLSATSEEDARLYFIAQESDHDERAAIAACGLEPFLVPDAQQSWAHKINRGYELTTEPWILLAADDLAFRRGWVDSVRSLLATHRGVVGTNDLGNRATVDGTHSTHPLVRRIYADVMGTVDERRKVVHDGYVHNFPDSELCATAKRRHLYTHCHSCVIEHLHPLWGKAKSDRIYDLGQQSFRRDQNLFQNRAARFGW